MMKKLPVAIQGYPQTRTSLFMLMKVSIFDLIILTKSREKGWNRSDSRRKSMDSKSKWEALKQKILFSVFHSVVDSSSYNNLPLPPPVMDKNAPPGRYIFKCRLT